MAGRGRVEGRGGECFSVFLLVSMIFAVFEGSLALLSNGYSLLVGGRCPRPIGRRTRSAEFGV